MSIIIKHAQRGDGSKYQALMSMLEAETSHLLYSAEERPKDPEFLERQIGFVEGSSNSCLFFAEMENNFVGFILGLGQPCFKARHKTYATMGVVRKWWGTRVAINLIQSFEKWAQENEISRIECTVIKSNDRAVRLYKKFGYEVEGVAVNSLKIENSYVDQFYMAKLL